MNFFELVKKRESVRGYLDKKVEREKIEKIIDTARIAPSACNSQPWKFIIVDDEKLLTEISESVYTPAIGINKFASTAPIFIVVVDEKRNITSKMGSIIKSQDYTSVDIGIVSEHICLAATELGLGTCMMGWFNEKKVKKTLYIPKSRKVHLIISLGYYEMKEPRKKIRKNMEEIISYNKY